MKQIVVITGQVDSGKTTFLLNILPALNMKGEVQGVCSPKSFFEGNFIGYDLLDISANKKFPFIRLQPEPDWVKLGKFHFNPEIIERGNEIIRQADKADILIIDEIGPLELNGSGFRPGLEHCFDNFRGTLIIVSRIDLINDIEKLLLKAESEINILHQKQWENILTLC